MQVNFIYKLYENFMKKIIIFNFILKRNVTTFNLKVIKIH
jgi:hypothetical protein